MSDTDRSAMERHAQTLLVLVLVALLIWVGSTTQRTSVAVAAMAVEIRHLQNQVKQPDHKFEEIERRLDSIEQQLQRIHAQNGNGNAE